MDFREVEGERKGSKVLITEDKHLYRYSKPNTPYIICYLGLVTKIMQKISPNVEQCHATGVVKDGQIVVHKEHNHIPDTRISERLIARKTARDGVTNSTQSSKQAFDQVLENQPGAELIGWGQMYRTCLRDKRRAYPPPPEDCGSADEFMRSPQYKDKDFAKYYQGLVMGNENEAALVFAHPQNLEKLGDDTKQISADGTFKTAPSLRVGHLYQILILLAMYKGHWYPVVKAIMTHKTRVLYDSVFAKFKSLLPDSVQPTLVITDYEPALMGGLSMIFPMSRIVGCWFHFTKAVFKYMSGLGLKEQFTKNTGFHVWMKLVLSLPLLPTDRITGMWDELKRESIPSVDGISRISTTAVKKLRKYIEKTWIVGKLDVLSVHKEESRTNNASESYNSKWLHLTLNAAFREN